MLCWKGRHNVVWTRLRVGSCRVGLPRLSLRVLIRFRYGSPGHIPRILVAITKPVGCGRRASGRTHLFPTGDGAHTHTATTSSRACGWGPRRGQDNGVVGRHEPTCSKPEFKKKKIAHKMLTEQALLPLRWPSARVYCPADLLYCGMDSPDSMYPHRLQSKLVCCWLLHSCASVLDMLNSRPANGSSRIGMG